MQNQSNIEVSQPNCSALTTIDVQQFQEDYSMDVQKIQNNSCSSLDTQQNQDGTVVALKKKGKLFIKNYFKCL